jgi:hypothetical protein
LRIDPGCESGRVLCVRLHANHYIFSPKTLYDMSPVSHLLARVACLFLLAASFPPPADAAQAPARPAAPAGRAAANHAHAAGTVLVVRVTGEAYAMLAGGTARTPLKQGSLVLVGQVIVTGKNASVILALSNGATVTIAGDSVMAVEEFTQQPFAGAFRVTQLSKEPTSSTTRLNLVKGEIISEVKKLNKEAGSSFSIRTPVGVAGIRGTAFRLAFLDEGGGLASFALVMLEGEIETRFTGRPAPVIVPQGKQLKLGHISIDPVTGEAKLSESEDVVVTDASASGQAAIARAVQAMISSAATVPVTPPGGGAGNAGGAPQEGAEQAGPGIEPMVPPAPGAQMAPPRLSPTAGE